VSERCPVRISLTLPVILNFCGLDYGLDDQGFESRQKLGIFLYTTLSRPALGPTQPSIKSVPGALSLGLKRPGREGDHPSPFSAEVKYAWSYTSTPQYAFMAWRSVETQGHFYLYRIFSRPMLEWHFQINDNRVLTDPYLHFIHDRSHI
jgi:hypothetical protein